MTTPISRRATAAVVLFECSLALAGCRGDDGTRDVAASGEPATPASDPTPEPAASSVAAPSREAPARPAVVPAKPDPVAAVDAKVPIAEEPEKPSTDAYPLDASISYPAGSVTAVPRAIEWMKVADLPDAITLFRMRRGVLGMVGDKTYGVGEDASLTEVDVDVSDAKYRGITGSFPDNAWFRWYLPEDSGQSTFNLRRWKKGRWVAQGDADARKVEAEEMRDIFTEGGRGGLVLAKPQQENGMAESIRITRVGTDDVLDTQPIPALARLEAIVETRAGRLHLVFDARQDGRDVTIVQSDCEGEGCEVTGARVFPSPPGLVSSWEVHDAVLRGRKGASLIGRESSRPAGYQRAVPATPWVVHVDGDDWSLESLPDGRSARALWSPDDAGLWVEVKADDELELWHRDAKGTWSTASLPEGFVAGERLELALTHDDSLWLFGEVDGAHGVWSCPASPPAA